MKIKSGDLSRAVTNFIGDYQHSKVSNEDLIDFFEDSIYYYVGVLKREFPNIEYDEITKSRVNDKEFITNVESLSVFPTYIIQTELKTMLMNSACIYSKGRTTMSFPDFFQFNIMKNLDKMSSLSEVSNEGMNSDGLIHIDYIVTEGMRAFRKDLFHKLTITEKCTVQMYYTGRSVQDIAKDYRVDPNYVINQRWSGISKMVEGL